MYGRFAKKTTILDVKDIASWSDLALRKKETKCYRQAPPFFRLKYGSTVNTLINDKICFWQVRYL
jgi:hypothetical protein